MKKYILIGSLLIFVFLVIATISQQKPLNLDIEFVNELETETKDKFKACVLKENGKLVLIDIEKKNNENIYLYVLKIYDHYRNSLPLNYQSPLRGNFEVKKLEKNAKTLEIEIEVLFLEENFKLFLTALMWTYQSLGIDEVNLKANKEEFHLKKDEIINLEIEATNYNYQIKQTIYFYQKEEIIPVTYLHEEDATHFLIRKLIKSFPEISFNYDNSSKIFILRITDPRYEMNSQMIETLGLNLEELGLYQDIVIVKNGLLVYNN